MKKKVFSLMMTLLLAFMGVAKADVVTIGEGTSTTYWCPFNSLYGYSFVEEIYTAEEVGMAGNITSISFDLSQSYSSEQTNDVVLYMKNVSRSTFSSNSDWETVTSGDIVFQGQWTIPANYTGWMTITLDTPFAYDGTSNLMIAIDENTSGYNTRYVHYTSTSNAVFSAHSDSYNPDPYNLGSFSGTKSTTSSRANIQIDITPGGATSGEITLHDGTTTNSYVPIYGFYADAYLKAEFVYPASELSTMNGGSITSMKFYSSTTSVSWGAANFQVFLTEVANTTISSFNGPGTVVYEGALSIVNGEMEVNFTTPYQYNGGNLLVGVYNTVEGSYVSCSWLGETVTGASVQGYSYSSLGEVSATQRNFLPKTTFDYTTAGGGAGAGDQLFAYQDGVEVDTIVVGPRPNNAWMEPFTFQLLNEGPATTVSLIDFTPEDYFTVVTELPLDMDHNETVDIALSTGDAQREDSLYWQMVAIYGEGRTARVWDIMVEAYDPAIPDVVEMAHDLGTIAAGFSYQGIPSQITPTELHDNYTLPFPEIEEGVDAVYKFTVESDMIINAHVDEQAENGKVALYTEDFYGEGGPMATNNYQGLDLTGAGGGGAAGAPFEAQIGEGTSTSGYFPFYSLYNYSLSAELFLAAELAEAGVTTAPFTSLSWNATNSISQDQNGITIWMANVSETEVASTSPLTSGMTKVYTGNLTQPTPTGWVEFVFNEGSFAWDGTSNILILCQRNNGSWTSSIQWQYHNPGFQARGYDYTDNAAYNAETTQYSWYTSSTTRANVIMKGGNRAGGNRDVITQDFENGIGDWTMANCHSSSGVSTAYTAHSGTGSFRFYYTANGDQYLISPELADNNGGTMSFYYACFSSTYPETFKVGYSSTTNDPTAFTWGSETTSTNLYTAGYLEYTCDFPAGTKYVSIACTSYDQFYLFIDDITITTAGGGQGGGWPRHREPRPESWHLLSGCLRHASRLRRVHQCRQHALPCH